VVKALALSHFHRRPPSGFKRLFFLHENPFIERPRHPARKIAWFIWILAHFHALLTKWRSGFPYLQLEPVNDTQLSLPPDSPDA